MTATCCRAGATSWPEPCLYHPTGEPDFPEPTDDHVHIWDNPQGMPIMRNTDTRPPRPYVLYSPRDDSPLWNGPCVCPDCGKMRFLVNGRPAPLGADALLEPPSPSEPPTIPPFEDIARRLREDPDSLTPEERALLIVKGEELSIAFQNLATAIVDAVAPFVQAIADGLSRIAELVEAHNLKPEDFTADAGEDPERTEG